MTGRIVKGIGGFYYVACESGLYECKARGILRQRELTPLAGDIVNIENDCIDRILPRKNVLLRPPASNIDQFALVLSSSLPPPDLLLADKLLIQAKIQKVPPLIILNKCDEADEAVIADIMMQYDAYKDHIVQTSAHTGFGIEQLQERLLGKLTCFAGQSAVGKSSLINKLCSKYKLETGVLSKKSGRGKHTTRATELLKLEAGGFVLDTPGFSLLDLDNIEPETMQGFYPEIDSFSKECRFTGCSHDKEPDCAVKLALLQNKLPQGRYDRYLALLKESRDKRRKRYD